MMERTGTQQVLVTGGTGFVGSHLVEFLLKRGFDVTCLVRDASRLQWLKGLPVRVVQGDCEHPASLGPAVRGISTIFHVAGRTKSRYARDYYATNRDGTANILAACRRENPGLKKFLMVSSLAAAGPSPDGRPLVPGDAPKPITDYGKSKLLAEEEVLRYKDIFPVVILRPSAVYGPRDRDMFELFRWACRGVMTEIGSGDHYINPCYVQDLASAMLLAAEKQYESGSIYHVAEKRSYSWSEFQHILLETGGISARTLKMPYAAAYLIGLVSEAGALITTKPSIISRQKVREAAQKYWVCDVTKTENELGFRTEYFLQRGLEITWQWYRENGWLRRNNQHSETSTRGKNCGSF